MTDTNWSVPETDVLASARAILDGDARGVLATVISVRGSAYRRPGAKMVIPEDGEGIGHITAGCLEDDVQRLAREVLDAGEPRVERYDLMPEEGQEEDVWGLGVGCNGVIDILLEPLDETYRPAVDAFDAGDDVGVLTVVSSEDDDRVGTRAYYDPADDAFSVGDGFPADALDALRSPTEQLTARGRAETLDIDGHSVFVDGLSAPSDLVVVGTGHDVGPIVEFGKQADFRVTVVGYRGASARSDRFPAADAVVSTSPARVREAVAFDADTYVVVATHNFIDDRLTVDELLSTDVPYVGLMGPKDRFEEMLAAFDEEDRTFETDEFDSLYTPVGLDLGGGSPQQIALSIVSELLAVENGRTPQHLRERGDTIHDRVELQTDGGE